MKSSSKGQITVFIIVGVIILFAVALTIYIKDSTNKVRPPVQNLVVSDEIKPIQVFVTDCLSAVSKDGLIRLGQNGGYINLPSGLKINPSKPYDSEALFFPPQVMPYWYYNRPCSGSSYGCSYVNNPPVCDDGVRCVLPYTGSNSMEEQMNAFIEENIDTCLDGFTEFQDRFDIKTGRKIADTRFTESGVEIKLEYPLLISIKGSSLQEEIPYFNTEHNLNFRQIYQFAQEIRDAQANFTFLERNTLNLITVYSGMDPEMLPPMSGLDMFNLNGRKIWIRSEVKQALMTDILPYTMLLQVMNAGNARQILPTGTDPKYVGLEIGLYDSMMLKVSETSFYPDLNVNIYYPPGSDIYFRIGDSEIIKPKDLGSKKDNIIMKMMNFAFSDYSFEYDLTYPVIVRIEDPYAFNGQGYVFSYAMQANIRQNIPVTMNMTSVSVLNRPSASIDDPALRVNRTITIETYDRYTKQPIEGVMIDYKCGYDTTIGQTAMKGGKAILQEQFPFCEFGGEIEYEKQGYMGGAIDYSNIEGSDPKNFRIEMWPLQEKKFVVYKRNEANINSIRRVGAGGIVLYTTAYTQLTINDTVFVNIERQKDDTRETDVPLVGFVVVKNQNAPQKTVTKQDQIDYINKLFADKLIDATARDDMIAELNSISDNVLMQSTPAQTTYTMEFVPGKYVFDSFMMYDGHIHVPAKNDSICPAPIKLFGETEICLVGKVAINYPEQNFSTWISGGAMINFTLTENDVYNNNTLVFYVAEMPLPQDWDDLEDIQNIEEYQADKLALLRPTIKYS